MHNKNALRHIKGSDILNRHRSDPVDDVDERDRNKRIPRMTTCVDMPENPVGWQENEKNLLGLLLALHVDIECPGDRRDLLSLPQ